MFKQLGPYQAILLVDARAERTLEQILAPESHLQIIKHVETHLAPTTRHLYVQTGVPVIYPQLHMMNTTIDRLSTYFDMKKRIQSRFRQYHQRQMLGEPFMPKDKWFTNVMNQFGLVDLADDLMDQWTHPVHWNERAWFLQLLAGVSRRQGVRVTFLSGDVHCCAIGVWQGNLCSLILIH